MFAHHDLMLFDGQEPSLAARQLSVAHEASSPVLDFDDDAHEHGENDKPTNHDEEVVPRQNWHFKPFSLPGSTTAKVPDDT